MLASALYLGLSLTPAMDAAQQAGDMATFDRLHHQYEADFFLVQMPLLLLLALFGALAGYAELEPALEAARRFYQNRRDASIFVAPCVFLPARL